MITKRILIACLTMALANLGMVAYAGTGKAEDKPKAEKVEKAEKPEKPEKREKPEKVG